MSWWNHEPEEYENSSYRFQEGEGTRIVSLRTIYLESFQKTLAGDNLLSESQLVILGYIERAIAERASWLAESAPERERLKKRIAGLLPVKEDVGTTPDEEQPAIGNLARTLWIALLVIIAGAAIL